jgi:hypothetical protein
LFAGCEHEVASAVSTSQNLVDEIHPASLALPEAPVLPAPNRRRARIARRSVNQMPACSDTPEEPGVVLPNWIGALVAAASPAARPGFDHPDADPSRKLPSRE